MPQSPEVSRLAGWSRHHFLQATRVVCSPVPGGVLTCTRWSLACWIFESVCHPQERLSHGVLVLSPDLWWSHTNSCYHVLIRLSTSSFNLGRLPSSAWNCTSYFLLWKLFHPATPGKWRAHRFLISRNHCPLRLNIQRYCLWPRLNVVSLAPSWLLASDLHYSRCDHPGSESTDLRCSISYLSVALPSK